MSKNLTRGQLSDNRIKLTIKITIIFSKEDNDEEFIMHSKSDINQRNLD